MRIIEMEYLLNLMEIWNIALYNTVHRAVDSELTDLKSGPCYTSN